MISETQFNAIQYVNGLKLREDTKAYLERYVNSDQFEIDTSAMPSDWGIKAKSIVAINDYLKGGKNNDKKRL